jgi:hypothetical protein
MFLKALAARGERGGEGIPQQPQMRYGTLNAFWKQFGEWEDY